MAQPLSVLLYSQDRQTLRRLSRALAAFGYETLQTCDADQIQAELELARPHFLLADAAPDFSATLEVCRAVSQDEHSRPFIFLMLEKPTSLALAEALQAGVDDFLARPIVYGELLARLRAAARVLELDRRLRGERATDPLTGLPTAAEFRRWLGERTEGRLDEAFSCVLMDVDRLERINQRHGRLAGDAVLRAIAESLPDSLAEGRAAYLGAGRFAMLLPISDAEAAAWASALCDRWRQADKSAESPVRFTVSCGIAVSEGASAETISRAEQALRTAKLSGRDCVVRFGESDDRSAVWSDFAAPGQLFRRTTARDVMTPCTLALCLEDSTERAAAAFARSSATAIPVVRDDGRLVGLALAEHLPDVVHGPSVVGRWMASEVPTIAESAGFDELRDFFTQDSRPALVVVREDRPVGIVTADGLAALTTPLSTDTFAPAADACDDLHVPDLRPLG